jgi:hypothetical protein
VACVPLAGCGDAPRPHGTPSRNAAASTARSYIDALNRRDGDTICALWSDELRRNVQARYKDFLRGADCARIETLIGYQEDNGSGAWTHAEVLRVGTVRITGDRAEVPVVEHNIHKQGGGTNDTISDLIHLTSSGGRWKVSKVGGVFYSATSFGPPDDALDPPGDPAIVGKPSQLPPPRVACEPMTTVPDPEDDVSYREGFDENFHPSEAPWLDLTSVGVSQNGDGTCFTIELAAPPRPDSSFTISSEQSTGRPDGSFTQGRPAFRIDGLDHPHASAGVRGFGVSGQTIYLLVGRPVLHAGGFKWTLKVSSLQAADPALEHPVKGDDVLPYSPGSERGLTFP